ncbi:MAG: alpha/beta hydrolase-fold protein, partial [Acidimicrobiales bacterium]
MLAPQPVAWLGSRPRNATRRPTAPPPSRVISGPSGGGVFALTSELTAKYSDEANSASAMSAPSSPSDWFVAAARSQAWTKRSLIAIWMQK